jgi:DNA-binding response OmpR family regulator
VNEKTSAHSENTSVKGGRVLVLEPDEHLASAILSALNEAAPGAEVDMAHSLTEAQDLVLGAKPDLFVLDIDATYDLGQEFLYDLRTSHPKARAIVLTAVHLTAHREWAAGLGAIHFLEKPFPHGDFVDLVGALLRASSKPESEKFQGTLSDLHIADIIQLKCMSGATAAIEFTGPADTKARVFFENGQVRHATAPGKEGIDAFNEIVTWKGGKISEVTAGSSPRTINLDWQVLLMEAVRKVDESGAASGAARSQSKRSPRRKVLAIDDSMMLLSFVEEVLTEAGYQVVTAATAQQSLEASIANPPDLILLDYILPDMKGNEVSRKLLENPATADIPVIYMSGFGADLQPDGIANRNVIAFLNKPFTSDLLIKTVEKHMPKLPGEAEPEPIETENGPAPSEGVSDAEAPPAWQEETVSRELIMPAEEPTQAQDSWNETEAAWSQPAAIAPTSAVESSSESFTRGIYFCGDISFFSLNQALQTIAKEKLTGSLRLFWQKEPVELLVQNGQIVLATTRDPELYCPDAPITLVNVEADKIAEARAQQSLSGCPLFLSLAQEELILREPVGQLVQHYGQKLFAQLWTARGVRFMFERDAELPGYASEVSAEPDVDHWSLGSLRFIQFHELGEDASFDPSLIPAYTKSGFERVQNLKLTVAEAQFASQFNGSRSIQQIAKNLRLDLKFARLTLFRFLALEIVECWSPSAAAKPERKSIFQGLKRSIGLGQ